MLSSKPKWSNVTDRTFGNQAKNDPTSHALSPVSSGNNVKSHNGCTVTQWCSHSTRTFIMFIISSIPIGPSFKNRQLLRNLCTWAYKAITTLCAQLLIIKRYTGETTKPDGQARKHQGIWFCFLPYYITSLWRIQIKAAPWILQDPCGAHAIPSLTKHTVFPVPLTIQFIYFLQLFR